MYTIGQVAKFLGVSRDTLKFYEEKQLVTPRQDDENGYRKYDEYAIYDVITTNFYRQLDIEIKKIQEIRQSKSVTDIEAILEEKKEKIKEEIEYKQRLLTRLEELEEGCSNIKNYIGQYTLRAMEPLVVKSEITDFLACEEYDLLRGETGLLKETVTLTAVRRIIYFDEKGVTGNRCVVVQPINSTQLPTTQEVLEHPRCIYTIVEEGRGSKQGEDVSEMAEQYLRKIGREKGYEPLGVVYINVLLTTYREGLERTFLEIYAPIKE